MKLSRIEKGSLQMRQPDFNVVSCHSSATAESLKIQVDLDNLKSRQVRSQEWSFEDDMLSVNGELCAEEGSK
jgi:hypothetical protein